MNCYIVGHPLTKPRSIKIWNRYFKKKKINMKMEKKDIPPTRIKNFIKMIKKDNLFYASAITMPYKKIFYKICKFKNKISEYSKSVNLVIKKNKQLFGYNTDILSLIELLKKIKKKNILIIGMGGTGEAIVNVFKKKYKNSKLFVITRKKQKNKKILFFKKNSPKTVSNKNLIINCTPLGSDLKKAYLDKSPISKNLFKYIDKNTVIFDLVYSPKITKLSKLCKHERILYLNGLRMNSLQAKFALDIAFR